LTVDLSIWALAESLTVQQAACLWCGVSPSTALFGLPAQQRDRIEAVKQMLSTAIRSGKLQADNSATPTLFGDYSASLVHRAHLALFAESLKQRPAFLFDTLLPADPAALRNGGQADERSRVGRPPEYNWDALVVEIIRIADMDGLPDKQSELVSQLLQWCENTWERQPAESGIKLKVSRIYNGLGRGQKFKG
jgi:hypothetical protein